MTTRRRLLQGIAASGLLGAPAIARLASAAPAPLPVLNNGVLLAPPDFDGLGKKATPVVGVRPHRTSGVCLKRDVPIDTAKGKKIFIHNYGHSGAGITLSWGCAAVVVDHVQKAIDQLQALNVTPSVAVLGTGVIGLTSATEIHKQWPQLPITIYAKSVDVRTTTSYVAGGQFEPSQVFGAYANDKKTLAGYLEGSAARIRNIIGANQGASFGIRATKNYTLDYPEDGFNVYTPCDVVPPYVKGKLPFKPLKPGLPPLNLAGREYSTWLLNPHIMLPKLAADLRNTGVTFVPREFKKLKDDVQDGLSETIVVNCTGLGAGALFADPAVVPHRGHLVVLKNPANLDYLFSGGSVNNAIFYLFARQDDIVIGGTVQQDTDTRDTIGMDDFDVFKRILANANGMFGGHPADCVNPLTGVKPTRTPEADPGACLTLPP